jgi:hypothetical protein
VADRAREVSRTLAPGESEVLIAAAYLHDIGYAPELRDTGFHPLDGARFLRQAGRERLAGLVAHHSRAEGEAVERGLVRELSEFRDEDSALSRALTYCDLTTSPEGQRVEPAERIAEIQERYGADAPETRALLSSLRALLGDVQAVEAVLERTAPAS